MAIPAGRPRATILAMTADPATITDPHALRQLFRGGLDVASTARLAPGHVQGNLVILPAALAADFETYCRRNAQACPLLAVSGAGDPQLPALGRDFDVRTDLPRYRVWRDGEIVEEPREILGLWREDFVAFVLGCSYSFEQALIEAGIRLRHWDRGQNPPYYRTSVETDPVGPFSGKLIVSMRPLPPRDAIRAVQITSRYPTVHGAPVHLGFPEAIGIADLARPDGGDPIELLPGELPVFWACGVTPESAIRTARPSLCITHKPGAMAVTDLLNRSLERASS
jgi:uncharacterized protein YcsI (UPF0317 family)